MLFFFHILSSANSKVSGLNQKLVFRLPSLFFLLISVFFYFQTAGKGEAISGVTLNRIENVPTSRKIFDPYPKDATGCTLNSFALTISTHKYSSLIRPLLTICFIGLFTQTAFLSYWRLCFDHLMQSILCNSENVYTPTWFVGKSDL